MQFFFLQAEVGIRDYKVTGVQTCTLPIYRLRRDLGSSARLVTGRPGAMQKVVRVTVRPGSERAFEDAVKSIATRSEERRVGKEWGSRRSGGRVTESGRSRTGT